MSDETTPDHTPASPAPAPPAESPTTRTDPRLLIGAILGLTVVLCLMLLAFAAPAIHSGPRDLPLGIAGPSDAVTQVETALDQAQPGAFAVTSYRNTDALTEAITQREEVGGITLGPDGIVVHVASAAGTPYAALLRSVAGGLAAGGQPVTVDDVVPLTTDDPAGSGLTALGLPLVFGGMISAVALSNLARRSRAQKIVGSLAFSLLAGFAATAILQFWLGSIDGPFALTALGVSLGIAAISLVVLGLESLLGYAGLGLGAVTMLFVANPLSGMATGAAWLPQPWGEIGQFLPVGAAGTAIRSLAFFDGGAGQALIVLAVWAVVGIALVAVSGRRTASAEPAGSAG